MEKNHVLYFEQNLVVDDVKVGTGIIVYYFIILHC